MAVPVFFVSDVEPPWFHLAVVTALTTAWAFVLKLWKRRQKVGELSTDKVN